MKDFKIERAAEDVKYALGAMIFHFRDWPNLGWESENNSIAVKVQDLKKGIARYVDHDCPKPGPDRYPFICGESVFEEVMEEFIKERS